jgi:large subunit ribosomal protein L25
MNTMEAIVLSGAVRNQFGKEAARKVRASGRTPAVLYGHGVDDSVAIDLDPRALTKALANPKGKNALFTIEVEGGQSYEALVREVQREPVSRRIIHVDLVVPDQDKLLVSQVSMEFVGKSKGVALGGLLRTPYSEIKILAKPRDIPASIELDVTELDIGDTVMASELTLPDDVGTLYDNDYVVARVMKPRGVESEEGEGGEAGGDDAEGGDAAAESDDE